MPESTDIRYAVIQHSSGPCGGYVVRTMYDGWIPSPYRADDAVKVYRRESAAQAHADKLNRGEA